MKKNLSALVLILFIAAFMGGCSSYQKMLKSGNREQMYHSALDYFEQGKYQRSLKLFEEITYYYQGTPREDTILYYTGMALYNSGDFVSSELIFDDFRRRLPRSPFIEDVEYMYSMGFYYSSPAPNRDQTITLRAILAINEYLERYPQSMFRELCLTRLDELQGKLYEKEFINAKTYFKIGHYKSAVVALKNALAVYPETPHREEILYLTSKSNYELATNSIASLQRSRYLDMIDTYYTFVAEFPESQYRKELDKMQETAREYIAAHPAEEVEIAE